MPIDKLAIAEAVEAADEALQQFAKKYEPKNKEYTVDAAVYLNAVSTLAAAIIQKRNVSL